MKRKRHEKPVRSCQFHAQYGNCNIFINYYNTQEQIPFLPFAPLRLCAKHSSYITLGNQTKIADLLGAVGFRSSTQPTTTSYIY